MFRVLLVEDNFSLRQVIRILLKDEFPNMHVCEAQNGDEALESLRDGFKHIILMDVGLPGRNGIELTKEIKTLYPQTRVFIFTADDSQGCRQKASESGADRFFVKSVTGIDEIITAVDAVVRDRGESIHAADDVEDSLHHWNSKVN